jgi:hypothetical protein
MDGVSRVWRGQRDRSGTRRGHTLLDTAFHTSNPILF